MGYSKENVTIINNFCNKHRITNYTINSDGSVDVDGDVIIVHPEISYFPFQFNKVCGNFYCRRMELTSLKGAPRIVTKIFNCHGNELTSLEYAPIEVGGYVVFTQNNLEHSKENIDILLRYDMTILDADVKLVIDRCHTLNNIIN